MEAYAGVTIQKECCQRVDRKKGHRTTMSQKIKIKIALTDTGLGGEKGKHLCCDIVTKRHRTGRWSERTICAVQQPQYHKAEG